MFDQWDVKGYLLAVGSQVGLIKIASLIIKGEQRRWSPSSSTGYLGSGWETWDYGRHLSILRGAGQGQAYDWKQYKDGKNLGPWWCESLN